MKIIILLVLVFQGAIGGGNLCTGMNQEVVENADQRGKNKNNTPEVALETLFKDDDATLLVNNRKLILNINSKPSPMSSKLLSTNFSAQEPLMWTDPMHLHEGLKIIKVHMEQQDYTSLFYKFFDNSLGLYLPKFTAEHYAVGIIRFQKPELYKILINLFAQIKKWEPLSPIDADCVLFKTKDEKLIFVNSRLGKKTDSEDALRIMLKANIQEYARAAYYTMRRRNELQEEDGLHKALVNALRAKLEDKVAIFEERENERCLICRDEMTDGIVLKCGHMYCKMGIKEWMKQNKTCPTCRAEVSDKDLEDESQDAFRKLIWEQKQQANLLK